MKYVITFFTHYDAMACKNYLKNFDIQGTLMPVPRTLSSSCGTCLCCEIKNQDFSITHFDGEEGVAEVFAMKDNGYQCVFKNE